MKKLIILLSLINFSSFTKAEDCQESVSQEKTIEQNQINTDVPKYLEGAVIIVRQKDGKESVVPAEKFKVVPRKQQFLITRTEKTKTLSCVKRNRASLVVGRGSKPGLDSSTNGSVVEVESRVGAVGGLQFQRLLNKTLSVGGQVQTNKTTSVLLGIDF